MEQNTRPAPDSDLEAYGDWVTVDTAAPPAPAVRQPPAATADVEIAAELTDAEEEFLGQLSDADHAAEAAATAPHAGHSAHNGNGAAESDRAVAGPSAGPGPALAPAAPLAAGPPPREQRTAAAPAASPAAAGPAPGVVAAVHAAAPAAPVARPVVVPPPLPAVPVPYAAVPEPAAAAQPAPRPPESEAPRPAAATAPPPAPSGGAGAEAGTETGRIAAAGQAGGGALAHLEKRIATLAAEVAEIAAEVARLQADGGSDAPADPAPGASDRVQVSLEELDLEQPADAGTPAQVADEAQEAGDREPAPMIRLVPIADEEEGQADDVAAGGDLEDADAGVQAASEPAHESSPPPSDVPFRNDVRNVLGYLDQLLDDLPPERVREFAQSPLFATYKALFAQLGLDD